MRHAAALLLALLAGCSEPPATGTGAPESVPVDSRLVDLLADVQIAEARADLAAPARRAAVADSLRTIALATAGLTEDDLRSRRARLARDPAEARATYDAVALARSTRRRPRRREAPTLYARGTARDGPSCRVPFPSPHPDMLHILTTGGTIDKVYFDAETAYEVGEPQIADILRAAGVAAETTVETLLRKDSLEMTDADRALVAAHVRATAATHVIVTHGTDTMAATARAVAEALAADDAGAAKTVVFVGSLTPARFKASDAEFNVGFAVAAVQTLPPGVYVAMNGRVFDPHHVRKSRERNRFEAGTPIAPPVSAAGADSAGASVQNLPSAS